MAQYSNFSSVLLSGPQSQPSHSSRLIKQRLESAEQLNEEVSDWLKERARIEEDYAFSLERLAKKKLPEISKSGIFEGVWQSLANHTLETSTASLVFSHKIYNDIEKPLRQYCDSSDQWSDRRRLSKDLDALSHTYDEATQGSRKAGRQLPQSEWRATAPKIYQQSEQLDESRLEFLKNSLIGLETLDVDRTQRIMSSSEATLNTLLSFEPKDDIATFAAQAATVGQYASLPPLEHHTSPSSLSTQRTPKEESKLISRVGSIFRSSKKKSSSASSSLDPLSSVSSRTAPPRPPPSRKAANGVTHQLPAYTPSSDPGFSPSSNYSDHARGNSDSSYLPHDEDVALGLNANTTAVQAPLPVVPTEETPQLRAVPVFKHSFSEVPGFQASISYHLSTVIKDGQVDRAQLAGEVCFSYKGKPIPKSLEVRASNFTIFERALPNTEILELQGTNLDEFSIRTNVFLQNPEVLAFKLVSQNAEHFVPVDFTSFWRVEAQKSQLMLTYKVANPYLAEAPLSLRDVLITIPVQGGHVKFARSKPEAVFDENSQTIQWRFDELVVRPGIEERLLCQFDTDGLAREGAEGIDIKFSLTQPSAINRSSDVPGDSSSLRKIVLNYSENNDWNAVPTTTSLSTGKFTLTCEKNVSQK